MAVDLTSLIDRELSTTAIMTRANQTATYTVLLDDFSIDDVDAFGGPERIGDRKIIFKAADLPEIAKGQLLTLLEPVGNTNVRRQKIVLSAILSSDGSTLSVSVKST